MLVVEIQSRFLRPVVYDDLITVVTMLKEMPVHHKIIFHSEIHNERNRLLSNGTVTLYFMNAITKKRCEMPEMLKEKVKSFFT